MKQELSSIELACTDALKTLKDETEVLEGRIKAMDDMKSSVAETVYLRVRTDYVAKRDQLEAQARPLRQEAREQYAKLLAALSELEAAEETVKLDKQEVELRHQLGEFDKKEYDKRTKSIEGAAAEQREHMAKAQEMRERFLRAVKSEDELRAAPAAPPPRSEDAYKTGELPAARPPEPARPAPAPSTVVMPSPAAAPAAPAAPAGGYESTVIMPAIKPAAPAAPAPLVQDATQMFRPSRLVPQNPEAGKTTYNLAIKTIVVGSDQSSDIRVGGPGVEPKHAQIAPTPQGYVIVDFDTKHGTRVNAEKVKERLLANEDVIQIGAARFAFRTG